MSDHDSSGAAWVTAPSRYFESRKAGYRCPDRPFSVYIPMRDGCRIAADIHLPTGGDAPEGGFPTVLVLTPYYRRFALAADAPAGTEAGPNIASYRDLFTPRGYAVVTVDVRGTGASFGTRDSFRSPAEREDSREIADWIVAQPWSNGVIGSTGVSYLGAAACFLASTGHPAVKAISPLFAVWNTWADHYYPGGVLLNKLASSYDELMIGLDHDRRDILANLPYFSNPHFAGPQPVDGDDGTLLRQAVQEHLANFHMPDFITEFQFADDTLPYNPGFSAQSFSPCHYADQISPDVAIYSISGWMDGAGFSNGAIARYLSLPRNNQRLLLGPWDHGARTNVSPWRERPEAEFNVLAEVLRFFDEHLMGLDTGLSEEDPVHYYTIGDETWKSAKTWPPVKTRKSLHLGAGGTLDAVPGAPGDESFQADFAAGTGANTRHERLAAINTTDYYTDWAEQERGVLSFTSAPLETAGTFTGHAVVDLHIASSEADAVVHVYLSEEGADGSLRYVTEGVLRALHRQESEAPPLQKWSWPYRDYSRAKAAPLVPGETARLRFALLPTSWTFAAGSRIRLSVAGADIDHYVQLPHGRPPRLTLKLGGQDGSYLDLPWTE